MCLFLAQERYLPYLSVEANQKEEKFVSQVFSISKNLLKKIYTLVRIPCRNHFGRGEYCGQIWLLQ